jgi:hypothetical protein
MGVVAALAKRPDAAPATKYLDVPSGVEMSQWNLSFNSSYIVNLSTALGIFRRRVAK